MKYFGKSSIFANKKLIVMDDNLKQAIRDLMPEGDIPFSEEDFQKEIGKVDKANKESAKERALRLRSKQKANQNTQPIVQRVEAEEILPPSESSTPSIQQALSVMKSKGGVTPTQKPSSREAITRLMTSLNINLDLQLTKNDTATLLLCLLTANEEKLIALQKNKRVPLVIKTVITRLLKDSESGSMDTIERMWDRLFGKTPMTESTTAQGAQAQGLLPTGPVSREVYVLIREQLGL